MVVMIISGKGFDDDTGDSNFLKEGTNANIKHLGPVLRKHMFLLLD